MTNRRMIDKQDEQISEKVVRTLLPLFALCQMHALPSLSFAFAALSLQPGENDGQDVQQNMPHDEKPLLHTNLITAERSHVTAFRSRD